MFAGQSTFLLDNSRTLVEKEMVFSKSAFLGASAFVGKIHNSLLQKAAVSLSPTPGKVRILPLGFARSPDNMAEFTSG
jgi:hypothetical protein